MIPLFHDFDGERVLVFGGGSVGARKARRFDREAEVRVVAPDFVEEDFGDAALIRAEPEPVDVPRWLDEHAPALVVAATDDPAVNAAIERAARDRGILVNRADRAGSREAGSVVVPAIARDDPVVVAIATGGNAPVLSSYLREQVDTLIDGSGRMAELVADIRTDLDNRAVPIRHRRQALREIVESSEVRMALSDGDENGAREAAEAIITRFE